LASLSQRPWAESVRGKRNLKLQRLCATEPQRCNKWFATIVVWASYGEAVEVSGNSFLSNIPALEVTYSSSAITGSGNYFGTTDSAEIDALILDRNDDLSRPSVIEYGIPATGPNEVVTQALIAAGEVVASALASRGMVLGTSAGDTLVGTLEADVIIGAGGNDTLDGGFGADTLLGGPGDDLITFSSVAVRLTSPTEIGLIDGGDGTDVLDLSRVSPASTRLIQNKDDSFSFGVSIGNQTFAVAGIESILFGSADNRITTSYAGSITIDAGAGNDDISVSVDRGDIQNIYGGTGDDTYIISSVFGSAGGVIDGGSGANTLKTNISFTVDLAAGTAVSGMANFTVANFNSVSVAAWLGYLTSVYGNAENNSFSVNDLFNDGSIGVFFDGRGGNDILSGSAGNDTLYGDGGDDQLTGGAGDDEIYGGDGTDTVVIDAASTDVTGEIFDTQIAITSANGGRDLIDGDVEVFEFTDRSVSSAELLVVLNNTAPVGNVAITGTAVQRGVLIADTSGLSDADGFSAFNYQWLRDGAPILQATADRYTATQADVGKVLTVSVSYTDNNGTPEGVVSVPTAAVINVNEAPTGTVTITGAPVEDATLTAVSTLADEDGMGELSYQWMRGGAAITGATSVTYTLGQTDVGAAISVRVFYTDGRGTAEATTSAATADIVNHIVGDEVGQTLSGTDAADNIEANGGYDWIIPGRGNDNVDGGPDRDMVAYSDVGEIAGRGVSFMLDLDLAAGTAKIFGGEVDQLTSIERVTGTIFADVMRGTNGNEELRGSGGYDWFIATPGNDTLDGGSGQDMITFVEWGGTGAALVADIFSATGAPPSGAAASGITLNLSDPSTSTGLAAGLTLTSVERVTGSSYQDVFYGDAEQNDFRGLGGYDWFVGSTGGRERYYGGSGLDTVTYFQSTSGVSASLRNGNGLSGGQETGYGSAGDAARDLYFEIENLVGSNHDDRLEGNSLRNQLSGLDGDDFIFGYGGIDYLKGGGGDDVINGGAGSDFALFGGNRADYTLTRTSATEVSITGTDGNDSLINVEYFQFDDTTANIWELVIV